MTHNTPLSLGLLGIPAGKLLLAALLAATSSTATSAGKAGISRSATVAGKLLLAALLAATSRMASDRPVRLHVSAASDGPE
jgi:hypothetical protein